MRLSVIVPSYNAEQTIQRCLGSITNSSFKDYELIVIDDGSIDGTKDIAGKFPCVLKILASNRGDGAARNEGARISRGEILVFVDADVAIRKDTLKRISDFFAANTEADAVVGLLSKTHPNKNFFSQYKNLYMNYIFNKVKNPVDFLFTSISAIRKKQFLPFDETIRGYNDTELGKRMVREGKIVILDKNLEVIHLKKYTFLSFIKNDFRVPFAWANIFLKYRSYKSAIKQKKFAHAGISQILSVGLSPVMFFLLMLSFMDLKFLSLFIISAFIFGLLNFNFFKFLKHEREFRFLLISIFATYLDMIIMGVGIFCGFTDYFYKKLRSGNFIFQFFVI